MIYKAPKSEWTESGRYVFIADGVEYSLGKHFLKHIQCESKKIPPEDLWQFFQNGWEFFDQILCAYYPFLSMLDCKFLFNYL